ADRDNRIAHGASCLCFFFFSSRRRHTRFSRDWSSDVCSSDLGGRQITATLTGLPRRVPLLAAKALVLSTVTALATAVAIPVSVRSEERRVGKECRWRGWTADSKQKRRR